MAHIVAMTDGYHAAIAVESVGPEMGWLLRAVCPLCKTSIRYSFGHDWWQCDDCKMAYPNPMEIKAANYYSEISTDVSYSMEKWVADWLGVEPERVTIVSDTKLNGRPW